MSSSLMAASANASGVRVVGDGAGRATAAGTRLARPGSGVIPGGVDKDGSGAYGVCFNDTRTEDPNFCYLACLEVADLNDVPMDMVAKTLPASAYAVFIHRGSLGKLAVTYEVIYRTWLPNSDYALAGSYDFESYPESFDLEDEARCVLEIWVPVKKKG